MVPVPPRPILPRQVGEGVGGDGWAAQLPWRRRKVGMSRPSHHSDLSRRDGTQDTDISKVDRLLFRFVRGGLLQQRIGGRWAWTGGVNVAEGASSEMPVQIGCRGVEDLSGRAKR